MEKPLISIIIPTYNRATVINVALDSVVSQTYVNWECIVVDDGSNDRTFDVLKRYQDSRFHFLKRDRFPKGAPTCRNIGLANAKGDYVIFLDSDDYLLPFCLEQRFVAIKENKDCDFLVFPMGKQKGKAIVKDNIPKYDDYLVSFLSANLPWSIMCPIWKISFLKQLGGFTEGYPRFNDPELMIRACLEVDVTYKILSGYNYDCVFKPSSKERLIFNTKVYRSLLLFIPDVVNLLQAKGKVHLKIYLLLYLHLWFKYFYVPLGKSNIGQSLRLLHLFKSYNIITTSQYISLGVRFFLYVISNIMLPNPIDKLTEKRLYKPRHVNL